MKKSLLLLFLFGAVIGSFLDSFHTVGGVAYYGNPLIWKMSWATPFILGGAAIIIGWSHAKIHPIIPNLKRSLIGTFLLFVLSYWITGFVKIGNEEIALILAGLYFIGWGIFDRTAKSLVLALATAVIGCTAEGLLGTTGFFVYTNPNFFHVPLWLFPLYAHASASVGNLGRIMR